MRRGFGLVMLVVAAITLSGLVATAAGAAGPVTTPTGNVSVRKDFWPLFSYVIGDADSARAKTTIVVARRNGTEVARFAVRWQRTNRVVRVPMLFWRADLPRGVYSWRVLARDENGERQRRAVPARLTVW